MGSTVVTGAQWGDEGKGRVVDWYAEQADIVARYQGGANAGHTVFVGDEKYALHLVPTGILRGKQCVIGNGVVVDPEALLEEIAALESKGVAVRDRLLISENAHLVMPYHKRLDAANEKRLGEKRIGTTLRGIAPAYSDKYARTGLRVGDLVREATFREKLAAHLEFKNQLLQFLYHENGLKFEEVLEEYRGYRDQLAPMVAETAQVLNRALDEGKEVLFEGAQGALLDVDFGTYPFCTSSNPIAGAACVGAGVGPTRIDRVIGVVKAYTSRVGQGPFLTELPEEIAATWRDRGGEFGSTTGRPRRVGWFDAVIVRKAAMLSSLDAIAVTHLDVLDDLGTIPICTHYRHGDDTLEIFPNSLEVLAECEPVYEELPGWKQPIHEARSPADLPANARRYLDRLAELAGAPVCTVLVGPRHRQDRPGRPRQRRHGSALDVLVGGVLSQNTSDVNSARAFESLMQRFGNYQAITDAPTGAIAAAIRSGGLARVKAPRIKRMLRQIRDRAPGMDLDRLLAAMSNPQARQYLTSINGVGIKTASVVLLFAMRRRVFPVDTHVHRVSTRLGWVPAGISREKAHAELEAMIPPARRYPLHVNLIRHGRETCRAQRPACPVCVLNDICPSAFQAARS